MRSPLIFQLASLLLITKLSLALAPPGFFRNVPPPALDHDRQAYRQRQHSIQTPMNPGPLQPPSQQPDTANGGSDTVTISDILPKTRSINIFASLTRDISSVSDRLESTLPESNSTLLAPLNSAMQALPRKPWENRPEDQTNIDAARNEDKAAENLRKFVEEHLLPTSPWKEGEKVASLGGQEMWWEHKDGKRVVMPGSIEVDGVVGRVGNGEIWALKGVVNYQ